jgi:integrase/recombinase XerD
MAETIVFPSLQQLPLTLAALQLNGAEGTNRERQERCQIHAKHDYEAIQCWLNEYRQKETTYRSYQKEAERLLLWSVFQCQKAFSSLDRDDFEKYFEFLDNPTPKDRWCARDQGGGRKRGDAGWRPFVGALSPSAKQTAIRCIDSLLNYLVDARYLNFNPLSLMRKRNSRANLKPSMLAVQERMLDLDEWHAMLDTLENLPANEFLEKQEKERLNFLINILYFLGLRINELATHTWNAFRKMDDHWWFVVMGKGDKPGMIPVCDELLRAVIQYRTFLKKAPFPQTDETDPLIASLALGEAIKPRQINKILKKLALETANKFADQPDKVKKLKKFSAHWLRHLSASMQDRAGIKFTHIQANHRHESGETTRRYVHAIDDDRHHDMQKLSLRMSIRSAR